VGPSSNFSLYLLPPCEFELCTSPVEITTLSAGMQQYTGVNFYLFCIEITPTAKNQTLQPNQGAGHVRFGGGGGRGGFSVSHRSGAMLLYLLPSSPSLNFVCFFLFPLSFSFCCCCCSIHFMKAYYGQAQ